MKEDKLVVKTKQENKLVTTIEDVICNKCGNSMFIDGQICGLDDSVTGCYGSPVFGDMDNYKFSLCEHCLEELFKTFKIPVETQCYYDDDNDSLCWNFDKNS